MYDYRRMTPTERAEVVEERRKRGFPLHRPPHPEQGPGWYFISAATFEHLPHFSAPDELTLLASELLNLVREANINCGGWVVLPNHYHLLLEADSVKAIGTMLKRVHGRTSYEINTRQSASGRKVWYNFADRRIRSERHYWACLHYIIQNPVKHGYVSEQREWVWSCVHELLVEHGEEWVRDIVSAYPLGEFGDKWDI